MSGLNLMTHMLRISTLIKFLRNVSEDNIILLPLTPQYMIQQIITQKKRVLIYYFTKESKNKIHNLILFLKKKFQQV